jgi:hypothetical protein
MKTSLLIIRSLVILLFTYINLNSEGQIVLLSENFSGFTTGTHSSPSPYDISANLDSKTESLGWTGTRIYSAGGEVKLGTADNPGWIETPIITLSDCSGEYLLILDIACRPGETPNILITFNGSSLGTIVNLSADFQTLELPITYNNCIGKIKIESTDKRFYLDNIIIKEQNTTSVLSSESFSNRINIFPNPAENIVSLINIKGYNSIEIYDENGRILKKFSSPFEDKMDIMLAGLPSGVLFFKFLKDKEFIIRQIIKF